MYPHQTVIKLSVKQWRDTTHFLCSQLSSKPGSGGIEIYELETSEEYMVLWKGIFLGNIVGEITIILYLF